MGTYLGNDPLLKRYLTHRPPFRNLVRSDFCWGTLWVHFLGNFVKSFWERGGENFVSSVFGELCEVIFFRGEFCEIIFFGGGNFVGFHLVFGELWEVIFHGELLWKRFGVWTCQKGAGGGTEPLLLRQKRAYMDELHVSIKHLLKAGVAFNLSNSFNHLFIHSQIEWTVRIFFSIYIYIYTGHIIERNFPFGKGWGAL